MRRVYGVVGGDRRQAELAKLLAADGNEVHPSGLSAWGLDGELERALAADVILLPLPLCKEAGMLHCGEFSLPTAELFRRIGPGKTVLAGQVTPEQKQQAAERGLEIEDYFLREELTVANAAATAEAAIQVAMEQRDRMLLGANCLVLGFGRIGKLLSHRLHGMGAIVTAAARKPADLAWIRAYGWRALEIRQLSGTLGSFDIVFNTVPSPVLDRTWLEELPSDSLCVDLASKPGIDGKAAEDLGLTCIWARGLPGRMVPHTAAEIIRDTIYHILEERGDPV